MEVTKHEQALIHEVMLMAYEQGVEEGKKQYKATVRELAERVVELKDQIEILEDTNSDQADELARIKDGIREWVAKYKGVRK